MKLPNSEKLQEILKEAKRISKKLGQNYIGSEHLLMALTFVSDTAPFVVLQENGVTIQSSRRNLWCRKKQIYKIRRVNPGACGK